jgi:molybdate transport system ATP-binding protein
MSLVFRNVHLRLGDMALELDATLGKKVTALFGTSSSGKTYLLELTAGLRRPEQGVIELDGVTLANISQRIHVPARRRAIGYVSQDLALFPHLSVRQNIVYGVKRQSSARPEISREKLCRVLDIERFWIEDRILFPGARNSVWPSRERCWHLRNSFSSMNHWRVSTNR